MLWALGSQQMHNLSVFCSSGPIAWSDWYGPILFKHNLSISLQMNNLNAQLQLHVRISVSKCKIKLTFI